MIVVSGVLVLVALVFLIFGLFNDGLGFIWASIVTSGVASVFLLLGALQRRGAPASTADTADAEADTMEHVTAVSVRSRDEAGAAEDTTAAATGGAEVAIVPGRPRYHTSACRFLAGRPDVETISLDAAKDEGYTACGVCKPDQAIAAAAAAAPEPPADEAAAETDTGDVTAEDTAATETADTTAATTTARARKTAAKPAKKTAAAATAAATTATKATKATKAAAKPAAATTGTTVVVVPDRGKYHTETCRFANAPGAMTVSKTTAKRQGYAPCGVCKP